MGPVVMPRRHVAPRSWSAAAAQTALVPCRPAACRATVAIHPRRELPAWAPQPTRAWRAIVEVARSESRTLHQDNASAGYISVTLGPFFHRLPRCALRSKKTLRLPRRVSSPGKSYGTSGSAHGDRVAASVKVRSSNRMWLSLRPEAKASVIMLPEQSSARSKLVRPVERCPE